MPTESQKRPRLPAILLGLALSAGAAVFLVWRTDFGALGKALASADVVWLLPAFVLFLIVFALRAWRWSVLMGGTPVVATWHANMIGYLLNCTLPLRLGEFARAYAISKRSDVSVARAFSSIVVERLVDLAAVLLLFAAFARVVPMRASFVHAATLGSVAVVVAVVGAAAFVLVGETMERRLFPRLEGRWKKRLGDIRQGFRAVGSARRLAHVALLTGLIWAFTIGFTASCLQAFLPTDALERGGFVVVISNLGGAVPAAPGGLGIIQGLSTAALVVPFGVPESSALAFVLVWSLSQQTLLVLIGLLSLGRVGLSLREIRTHAQESTPAA